jgi:hypothetical protein
VGLAREPLCYFALAGGALFGLHAWLGAPAAPPPDTIRVTSELVAPALEAWRAQTGREPTPEELRALVADCVRQEVLVREALALGLHAGDHVVRERLAQVMGFAAEDRAAIGDPDDAALAAFVAAHPEAYRSPDRVSFAHVFFDAGRPDAAAAAQAALARLQARGTADGDAFASGLEFDRRSTRELRFLFGAEFVAALIAAPLGAWHGPVASAQGLHCVRVAARESGTVPPLAEIRDRVTDDWRAAERLAARERDFAERRVRYRVEYADGVPSADGQ